LACAVRAGRWRPPGGCAPSPSPAAARQAKVFGSTTSGGHVELPPVQTSSGSQASPEPARHTVPAFPAGCWHALLVPSQASVVHGLPSLEHAVPDGLLASAGQLALVPLQLSAGSHSPADAPHRVSPARKPSAGH